MVKQKLDIGFFTAMYSQTNGTAHAVRFLSEAIAKQGHNVHVFAPRIQNGYKKPKNLHFHNFGGARISSKTDFVLSFPIHEYFFCEEDYLDITHIHTHATFGTMAINWAKYLGIPMVATHNSPLQFYAAQYVPIIGKILTKFDLIWRYERHILEKYDLIHVPTPSKKSLLREYNFKEPIFTLTNGIHDMYYQELKTNGILEKYGLKDKKVMLYASRLSPEKHPIAIIKAFKKIHKEVPDAHLLLVGSDGPSTKAVKKLLNSNSYSEFVTYAGRVPFEDLLKLYDAAHLTCLWSFVEAEGLVLIEAMAQGTPNVGANACGIQNVIRHGETGYLADNLKEFQRYVIKLMKDDDIRIKFGKKAKEVAQHYRVSEIAKTWIDIYKFTINQLYPLRYYKKERKHRVKLAKNFLNQLPNASF
jgi:glycosyltransferase involved in cell wall biosynthesis